MESKTRSIPEPSIDLFEHSHNGHGPVKQVPGSLPEALTALDKDHAFLLKGDVFTKDVLETWIDMKRTKRSIRCACARTRMSFICITTCKSLKRRSNGSSLFISRSRHLTREALQNCESCEMTWMNIVVIVTNVYKIE